MLTKMWAWPTSGSLPKMHIGERQMHMKRERSTHRENPPSEIHSWGESTLGKLTEMYPGLSTHDALHIGVYSTARQTDGARTLRAAQGTYRRGWGYPHSSDRVQLLLPDHLREDLKRGLRLERGLREAKQSKKSAWAWDGSDAVLGSHHFVSSRIHPPAKRVVGSRSGCVGDG